MKAQRKTNVIAKTVTEYPAGTKLKDIKDFDRSTHVMFNCPNHSESKYMSKDPFCSSIFILDGWANECNCPMGEHVTIELYRS